MRFKRRTVNRIVRFYKWLYNRALKANEANLSNEDHFALVQFQTEFNESANKLLLLWNKENGKKK